MSTQHTPGPWTVHSDGTVVAGLYPIARTFGGREASDYNARLIAAAPSLLSVLEDVRRIVANQLDNALFPPKGDSSKLTAEQAHVRERLSMASRMARNAIAEAKGE